MSPIEAIWNGIRRVIAYVKGGSDQLIEVQDEHDLITGEIPAVDLSQSTIANVEAKEVVESNRWTVTDHEISPFEKVGRIYLVGQDMVIRSDLDNRGFRISLAEVDSVMNGELKAVRLLESEKQVGTARISTSGRAMNFTIDPFFYTTPLQSLRRMLAGEQRKAPLFVGREQVEGPLST